MYSYRTPIRVWGNVMSHTRMGCPIRVWDVRYAYGPTYAYGAEHISSKPFMVHRIPMVIDILSMPGSSSIPSIRLYPLIIIYSCLNMPEGTLNVPHTYIVNTLNIVHYKSRIEYRAYQRQWRIQDFEKGGSTPTQMHSQALPA